MNLDCETCLRLWADYGVATTELRTGAVTELEAAGVRVEAIREAIRAHEAKAHSRNSDIAKSA